ncbi:hypothetical protein [Burkholderia alba]|uniref:hypothetical protein n=1 Tax=Burkholderia alba TaxID=2683677 RepID=UPI002B055358|nr:hypothetical protein [Burkholderia alba]
MRIRRPGGVASERFAAVLPVRVGDWGGQVLAGPSDACGSEIERVCVSPIDAWGMR